MERTVPMFNDHMDGSLFRKAAEETGENFQCEYFVSKAILSSDPMTTPNDYALLLIYGDMRKLGVWKSGATHWSYINWSMFVFSDIIFSHGQFLAVNEVDQICSLDIDTTHPTLSDICSYRLDVAVGKCRRYIVELPDGIILQVIRSLRASLSDNEVPVFYTLGFIVYRQEERYWVRMRSLSDGALFLGNNNSWYVDAFQFPGCRRNSVYFVDDIQDPDPMFLSSYQITSRRDIGVYHLDDGSIEDIDFCYPWTFA